MISIYNRQTQTDLNLRKLEVLEKYNKIIQWGRKNPTRFIEEIFKIQLFDYQKWVIMNTWTTQKAVWACSRNAGKSFLGAVYIMAKTLLFSKFHTLIMAPSARQSFETFGKIEDIVKKNIPSLMGTTDVFFNELLRRQVNTDGFTHDKQGYSCELYNGSEIKALVGQAKTIVGFRSHLNFYDEAGKCANEFFELTEPFTAQNASLVTGTNIDPSILPPAVPTQCVYASSAEDDASHLFDVYKLCATKMMMGVPGYFCADINCEIPLHPYMNGIAYTPLLSQEKIDDALAQNESKALREYFNIFDKTGGVDAVVKRGDLHRNEIDYLPVLETEGGDHEYLILWDPALQQDNSIVLVGEVLYSQEKGWYGRVVHCCNLIETLPSGKKRMMRTTDQLDAVKEMILKYNGSAPEYEKVGLNIDAGSGGGGRHYGEELFGGWISSDGQRHRGLIDLSDPVYKEKQCNFPLAVDKLRLLEPSRVRTKAFEAMGDLISQDLIQFPSFSADKKTIILDDKIINLNSSEIRSLAEIDLLKEEITSLIKTKGSNGNIKYGLPPDKIRRMHDDRAYCLALFALHISDLRRNELLGGDSHAMDMGVLLKKPNSNPNSLHNNKPKIINPFKGGINPFKR